MLRKFYFLLLLFAGADCFAQTAELELQNKYFTARNRLKRFFVEAGPTAGKGIPTQQIKLETAIQYPYTHQILKPNGEDSTVADSLWDKNSTNIVNTEPTGSIIADNPLIIMGEYLSVLSTEYWLMKHYGKTNTEEMTALRNEIYFALGAIDRLDYGAEKYFNPSITQSIQNVNGFLRRDDIEDHREDRINNYQYRRPGFNGQIQTVRMLNRGSITPDTMIEYIDSEYSVIHVFVKDTLEIDSIFTDSTRTNWTLDSISY
ncbi:MAG: hypothetical protein JNL57_10870, partial [Bacteroidetes bacterium]|nr:hypothetical protein [Bacteroidota bacterium]